MALYGSSVPLLVNPDDRPFAVMVICPNQYSHQRLLEALNTIVPEAGQVVPVVEPTPPVALAAQALYDMAIERAERDDDAPGACNLKTGVCE